MKIKKGEVYFIDDKEILRAPKIGEVFKDKKAFYFNGNKIVLLNQMPIINLVKKTEDYDYDFVNKKQKEDKKCQKNY